MTRVPFDTEMMSIALRMAERGLGQTAPNPAVGAVIADENTGEVIARGWTQPGGRPHAETEAIRRAGSRARGASLYVTLEPCAHQGKTPPCAEAIIAAGLKRVVVGISDPDPRTAGKGIAGLLAAGIEVAEGVLADAARRLTLGHILRVTEGRPFVQIKLALDAAGHVARGKAGQPVWVTGAEARAAGHLLRAQSDAIIVGANTVVDDDPALTCRLPGLSSRSPVRIVLTTAAEGLIGSALVKSAREAHVWVFCGLGTRPAVVTDLGAAGVEVFQSSPAVRRLAIAGVLKVLAERGITRLLVEGGPSIWQAFDAAGVVDEAVLFQAGTAKTAPGNSVQMATLRQWLPNAAISLAETRRIGDDLANVFRRT